MIARALCLSVGLFSAAAFAQAPNPYLVQAKTHYQSLDFERCLKRAAQGAQAPGPDAERAEVMLYSGLCNMGLSNARSARHDFQAALRLQPTIELPPFQSPRVVAVFEAARAASKDTADAPVAVALTPAPEPAPAAQVAPNVFRVSAPQTHLASLMLGASAVIALGAALVLGLAAQAAETAANTAHFEVTAFDYGNQSRAFSLASNIGYGLGGALAISAVVTFFLTRTAPTMSRSTWAPSSEARP